MSTITPARRAGFERSREQRLTALAHANRIRSRRAQFKRDMKADRRLLMPALLEPPDYAKTMKVLDLLLATPKIGRVKALKALRASGVSPSKTLAGMSDRQRREIARFLGGLQ